MVSSHSPRNIYLPMTGRYYMYTHSTVHVVECVGGTGRKVTLHRLSLSTLPPPSSSSTCVFYLLTMTSPILLPASLHITLAPYNIHYPSLGEHLHLAGLSATYNCMKIFQSLKFLFFSEICFFTCLHVNDDNRSCVV